MSEPSIKERLAKIEEQIKEIKENDLLHIEQRLSKVEDKINQILVTVIVVAFLAGINLVRGLA